MDNLLMDKIIFKKHIDTFLAQRVTSKEVDRIAYSCILNVTKLTNVGFNVIMGRNKQHN